jgi:hypothetical protein
MKNLVVVAIAALSLVGCGDDDNPNGPSSGPITFTVQMSAAQEVPAVTGAEANATGTATITFDVPRDSSGNITGGGSATFNVQMSNFPAGATAVRAHIHPGSSGDTGSPLVDTGLTPGSPVNMPNGTGSFNLTAPTVTQDQAMQIVNNPAGFYFNVHTTANPNGAIRGQLVRQQ